MARIVLIDDEAELRVVLGEVLADAGHEAVLAASGAEGLAALHRQRPDLVLCDIHMPDLDGFAVLRAVRADPQLASLPFVFLTSEAQLRTGMLAGADDYLMKPVSSRDLLAAVDARLARMETTRQEANRQVDEMRRTVAVLLPHEIRTPLTVIIGSARLLREFHGDFPPADIEQMATGMLQAAQRLHRMAENYILYADLELQRLSGGAPGGRLAGSSGALDVRMAAEDAAAHNGRSADLDLDVGDVVVPIAPAYLRKIASELADNAFKFSEPGQVVRVSLAAVASDPVLEVVDHGRGMAPDQTRDVGAFRQFDRGRFEQQGSGVGLALVRSIAEAGRGHMEITSRLVRGTTVRIRWPA